MKIGWLGWQGVCMVGWMGPVCISGYDLGGRWGSGSGKTPALSKAMKRGDPGVGSEQLIPTAIQAEMLH